MSIAENSFFCRMVLSLWHGLMALWRESALYGLFARIGAWIRRVVGESVVCNLLWREGKLVQTWPDSLTCKVITAIFNLPGAVIRLIYRSAKNLWDGSLCFRAVTGLGSCGAALMGLLAMVMLSVPHGSWNNVYGFLGAVAVTALFILSAARGRRLEYEHIGPYHTFFFGFVCIALVSSISTDLSLRFFLFHLTGLLMVLVLVSAVKSVEQIQWAAALAGVGLFVASLYGCYQGVTGVKVVASQQDMTVNAGMPGRVYSFFDNPNNFAEILVLLLPLMVALLLNSRSWTGRFAALVGFGTGVIAIGYTYSRSGWLGLLLAAFVFLALKNWKIVPFAIVAGVAALPFLPETIYNRFLTIGNTQDSSTRYRFAIYEATWTMMKDYWVQGVGLGSDVMTQAFKSYPTMFDGNHPIHTHNNYLQMWGELGIFGGIAYIALVLSQVKRGVKAFYTAENKRVRNLLAASVGSFCGILLISIAEYTWFYPRNMFLFWFLFGVISACVKLVKMEW